MDGATPTIVSNELFFGQARYGGAIYCKNSAPTVIGCTFYSNYADAAGGHLLADSCAPIVRNCLMDDGTADRGGAIYLQNSVVGTLLSTRTIGDTECSAPIGSTGVIHGAGGSATLENSIVAENALGVGIFVEGGHVLSVRYCDVWNRDGNYVGMGDPTGSNGNISANPQFAFDYHLKSMAGRWDGSSWVIDDVHSPCIDAGDPTSHYSNEPAPNGARINMGAFGNTAEASKSLSPPSLKWVGTAGYETDGVDPDSGQPNDTVFTFRVLYTDATGRPPRRARCLIQRLRPDGTWEPCRSLGLALESGNVATGAIYSAATQLPNQIYKYRFHFVSSNWQGVGGEPAGFKQGPMIGGRPFLEWTGAKGFETDGVDPDSGPAGTNFRFQVRYRDSAGNAPVTAKLLIRRNGVLFREKTLSQAPGGNLRLGKTYRTAVILDRPGVYEYRFNLADESGTALGPPNSWTPGPIITDGAGLVTSLAVLPTRRAVQVTVDLSGAARVTATVLNLAGRPVWSLITEKSLEAGRQTFLWDRRADTGLAAPRGLYLIRVTAHARDGSQSSALATVCLE